MGTWPRRPTLDEVRFDIPLLEWMQVTETNVPTVGPVGAVWGGSGDAAYWVDPDTGDRVYNPATTIHFVGDVHVGLFGVDTRLDIAFSDFAANLNPIIAHRVYVGDLIETPGDAGQLATAKTRLASAGVRSKWDLVGGNHDIVGGGSGGDTWMAAWGYGTRNWAKDLPFVRLIGVTQQTIDGSNWMTMDQTDLDWIAAQLASTDLPCVIVTHAPLSGTVLDGPYPSTDHNFHARPDATIRAILNSYSNAYMWVSGHTHTPITDDRILTYEDVGDREVVCLNCSAIAYVGGLSVGASPIYSPVVTFDSNRVTVRWRDSVNHNWATVDGTTEMNLPPLVQGALSTPVTLLLSADGSTNDAGPVSPTVAGGITTSTGVVGNWWDVPAGGDGITINGAYLDGLEGSLAFWFQADASIGTPILYLGNSAAQSFSLQIVGAAGITFNHRGLTMGLTEWNRPVGELNGTGPHLLYLGWSAATNKLYLSLDGQVIVSHTPDYGFAAMSTGDIKFGRGHGAASSVDSKCGPAIFNSRPLTQEEIDHLYARRAAWTLEMLD